MEAFEFKIQKPSSFKTYPIAFPNVLVYPSNFKVKNSSWYEWILELSLNGGFKKEGFWSTYNRFNKCFGSPHNCQEKNGKKCTEVQTKLDLFKASRNEWMNFRTIIH